MSALRSLPRLFVPGATPDGPIELRRADLDRLRKVLRLSAGAEIAVLPNDGSLVRCTFTGRAAEPIEVLRPRTESMLRLTVYQALPKGDKLDEIVRACTELGVAAFRFFSSDRTVVRWEPQKLDDRLARLGAIAREASELSFRTLLPEMGLVTGLEEALHTNPGAVVLSEVEDESNILSRSAPPCAVVVGPEGGWSPRELVWIGERGVTLGPRVLRVDHAAAAAAALLLCEGRD